MIVASIAIAVVIGVTVATASFWVNWWWFGSVGYRSVLVTRYLAQAAAFALGGLLAAGFFWANWTLVLRRIRGLPSRPDAIPGTARWLRIPLWLLTALLGLVTASGAAGLWDTWLLALNGGGFGLSDPVFGREAGFYVFALPALTALQRAAVALLLATAVVVVALYALLLGLDRADLRHPPARVRTHVLALGGGLLLLIAVGYLLANYRLVYSTRGAVYGVGFTDANVTRWANYLLALISAATAALLLLNSRVGRPRWLVIAAGSWVAAAILLGVVVPAAVQQTLVEPSELSRERGYIEDNIGLTRAAFDLNGAETRAISGQGQPPPQELSPETPTFDNIRLWDYRVARRTYDGLRSFVPYYRYLDVDVDRYELDGRMQQVLVAARELDVDNLPASAQTWPNLHLAYTHGYGGVVSPVNEATPRGEPVFLVGGIPPEGTGPLAIGRPEIYFGEEAGPWVAVNTGVQEISGIAGETEAAPYEGTARGAIGLDSYPRRLLLALVLGDRRVLFSGDLTEESQVLLRRQVRERVAAIAPFLSYDEDPYLVILDGRLVWVVDAYTETDRFPGSTPAQGLNYVRNSVKATVDAYDGAVTFYRTATADPIADAYDRVFGDLFVPIADAPPGLAAHFRYPERLFALQSEILASYHVTDPAPFYNGEDRWAIAREQVEDELRRMEAYYVTLPLPGEPEPRFGLVLPFTPSNSQNMTAWVAARTDDAGRPELLIYRFPRQVTVRGPQQIESQIDSDPIISPQITLLNTEGSRFVRGNLLVIPIGETVLYAQPVYLEATNENALPELEFVILATNERTVMRPTLAEALAALATGGPPLAGAPAAPAAPNPGPAAPAAADVGLAQQALDAYERAQQALARGDWAAYGQEQAALEGILRQLSGEPEAAPVAPEAATPTP